MLLTNFSVFVYIFIGGRWLILTNDINGCAIYTRRDAAATIIFKPLKSLMLNRQTSVCRRALTSQPGADSINLNKTKPLYQSGAIVRQFVALVL